MANYTTRQLERWRFAGIVAQMNSFISTVTVTDFAFLPITYTGKTQYKRRHAPRKRKGKAPSKQFEAIDDFIDLQLHLERGEYHEAIPLYYRLKRILNR